MEDDEEFRSHASPVDSDSSSPPAGRITVTVASAGPPSSSSLHDSNALALALPMKSSGGGRSRGNGSNGRSGGGGGREDSWSEGATAVLIDAWGQKYLELSRGNLKQNHWKEVAEIVSSNDDYGKIPKTDIQCKNRIDTVKKKYKQEKAKIASGDGPSRWVFFDKLDRLIGSTAKIPTPSPGSGRLQNIPVGIPQNIPVGIPTRNPSNLYNQLAKSTKPPFDRLMGATARIPSASLGGGGSYGDVPTGIPVNSNMFGQRGRTSASPVPRQGIVERCSESKRWRFKKRNGLDSDSESDTEMSADSADSLPPPPLTKRVKIEKEKVVDEKVDKWKELSLVIKRFGEAYEEIENAKLQQFVEMEKTRLKFMKEMELQRMQFFIKTQMEISRLKQQQGRRNGVGDTSRDHHHNDENKNNKKNINT